MLIIFIDTLSRQRLHKKLPETVKYFKEHDPKEFFRLHSFLGRTTENAMSFLYGKTLEDFLYEPAYDWNSRIFKEGNDPLYESIFEYFKE